MKDKLFELINQGQLKCVDCKNCDYSGKEFCGNRKLVDYLIDNGVTFDKDINALTKKVARLEKSNRNWRRKHQRLKADAVSRGYHDQVRWERDVAIEQLEDYGICLGEKACVVKLPYEPTPFLKDNNPHNTDAYCPECGTNLSGYFGGESLPIVTCFECGEIINPYMAMTKDELAEWRKERQ